MKQARWMWIASLIGVSVCAFGCGDDDGAVVDAGMDARVDDEDAGIPTFIYADVPEPYAADDVAACKAYSQADEGLTETVAAQRECYCDACVDLMRECDALPGCTEIRQCAWRTGCTTPTACYLLPGAPCRAVIDRWGNGSVSAAVQTELGGCGCSAP